MKWIKITDKCPEKEQTVIIYFRNKAGWHVGSCFWTGDDFIDLCDVCGQTNSYRYSIVTHWMLLPERPD